jgi:hypothetical protein
MMSCIVGAIMLCGARADITIDGPLRSARSYPAQNAWAYAAYAVPVLNPVPFTVLRRG